MAQVPPPPPNPSSDGSPQAPQNFSRLRKTSLLIGSFLIVGGAVGAIATYYFVYNRLSPFVENILIGILNRPVELGDVKGVSLSGLEIDGAAIPPTETDENYAHADLVQVGFRPIHVVSSLIRDRTLPITVTLIDPEVYGFQDNDGNWLRLDIQTAEEEAPITVALDRIQAKNATVVLAPYPQALSSPWENQGFFDALDQLDESSSLADTRLPNETGNDDTITEPSPLITPVLLQGIDVSATLRDKNRFAEFNIAARLQDGGQIAVQGDADIEQKKVNVVVRTTDLQVAQFSPLVPLPGRITAGSIDTNLRLAYHPNQPIELTGTARTRDIVAQLDAAPQPIADLNSRLRFDSQDIVIENTSLAYGDVELTAGGNINLETGYDLTAQIASVTLEDVQNTVNLDIPFSADGAFAADVQVTGALTNPIVDGVVRNIQPLQIDQIDFQSVIARFQFVAPVLDVRDIEIVPTVGGLIAGSGQVNLEADGGIFFDMRLTDVPGDAFAQAYNVSLPSDYQIGTLDADVEVFGPYDNIQAIADWQIRNSSFPGQGEIRYTGNTVRVQDTRLAVEGGTVVADATVNLDQGNWQASVNTNNVDIGQFSPQVEGILSSDIALSGQLDNLSPEAIALSGQARLANAEARITSDSPSLIESGDWNTQFRWTGNGIQIEEFTAPGIEANGFIAATVSDSPAIGDIDLNVAVRQYDLSRIEPLLPSSVQQQARLQGFATFIGQLSGSLTNPQVIGNAQLDTLAVNAFAFNSSLNGEVQFSLANGGMVDLEGGGDRIFVQVDDRFLPTNFLIRNSDGTSEDANAFIAEGRTQGDVLTAEIRNFRLSQLQFNPFPGQNIGIIRGVVNANIEANLADLSNPSVTSSVAIAQPAAGYIIAERFTGQLRYQNGRAELSQSELQFGNSSYQLSAQANVSDPDIPYQAELTITEGHVQDILTALQILDIDDLRRGLIAPQYQGASDLITQSAGLTTNASLLDQLDYINDLIAQREEAIAQEENSPIPSLDELDGNFEGTIAASGSLQSDFLVKFDLRGDDWAWGAFNAPNDFVASGTLTPQTLTVQPFRFESGEAFVTFDGQIGFAQQSGTLAVRSIPIELIQEFVSLPVDVEGDIHANADIGGTLNNPEVIGDITLVDPLLNETSLEYVQMNFTYDEARLILDGGIFLTGRDGMTIAGNIPYALPFMTVQPESDQISADLDIQNEGLALLNIVSKGQALWEGGQGDIDLRATGTLTQPLIQGTASFQEGIISSPLLDEPLTGITGTANFNLDSVEVDDLTAQFGDGAITVHGILPLFNSLTVQLDNALTVSFNETNIGLQDLLRANIDGNVVITGAALAPVISGNLNVSNGRVLARNLIGVTQSNQSSASDNPNEANGFNDSRNAEANPIFETIQFDDFKISLRDSLQIAGRPFFELAAIGDLSVNGTFADIKPDGTIRLTNGWINIIATQFRLDQDAENTATFSPEQGLDPDINVQMVARVREVDRVPIAPSSPFATAEVVDQSATPTFGGLQTVEVFATVDGPASQLSENLELTSDPTRSENQIVALIGGQTIDAIQDGNIAVGVASYVGSGFLAGFSNDIANILGLSEFSIFPTTGDVGGESRLPLAIGVEAGFDITRDFSVSVLEVLDGGSQPQFNFRYQLTDQLRLRASTNLDEDSRAILEFRSSF